MLNKKEKPYFISLLETDLIIKSVVVNNNFSQINLENFDFSKNWDNNYTFKNITIGEYEFQSIRAIITSDSIRISLLSSNTIFFDKPYIFFETAGIKHEKEPFICDEKEIREFRMKLGSFKLFDKFCRISVLKSDLYGCIINLALIVI